MSGGTFEHREGILQDIIDTIKTKRDLELSQSNLKNPESFEDICNLAITHLELGYTITHRLDWYFAGDDGEDTMYKRLKGELEKLKEAYEI